jgi:hypothetical protein
MHYTDIKVKQCKKAQTEVALDLKAKNIVKVILKHSILVKKIKTNKNNYLIQKLNHNFTVSLH